MYFSSLVFFFHILYYVFGIEVSFQLLNNTKIKESKSFLCTATFFDVSAFPDCGYLFIPTRARFNAPIGGSRSIARFRSAEEHRDSKAPMNRLDSSLRVSMLPVVNERRESSITIVFSKRKHPEIIRQSRNPFPRPRDGPCFKTLGQTSKQAKWE